MVGAVMVATVWTIAVPFYLRFLVALFREVRRVKTCYLVRLQPAAREVSLVAPAQEKALHARAA
jgi:hypothetical protein